ncbi:MAG: S1-like domain-containing RNA-binding protein [Verrucomicrobiota bacterium]
MALIGKTNALVALRETDHGLVLDGAELGEILLPNAEVPEGAEPGDEIKVFISRDSEDRLVATSQTPNCEVGDVVALEVVSLHHRAGAFLDWGFPKDLLLPYREQNKRVREGDRVVVKVLLDSVSNRIIATSRINRFLNKSQPHFHPGDAVSLIIHEKTPLGYMAVIDQRFRGLIHENRISRPLHVGEALDGYIAEVKEDGKIDLSLEPIGYSRVTQLTDRILEAVQQRGGKIPLTDKSSPEAIREAFGTSKKAFKQAVGALYRQRKIELTSDGIRLVTRDP